MKEKQDRNIVFIFSRRIYFK